MFRITVFLLFTSISLSLVLLISGASGSTDEEEIDLYTKVVDDLYESAKDYILPKNAREYEPKGTGTIPKLYGDFTYIVIGLGAAGAVVANRLSEDDEDTVLGLEAGNFGNLQTDIPNLYFPVEFTEYNWGFNSTPQETSCLGMVDDICPMARGRGVGGTTLINGGVYSRGHYTDYDRLAAEGNHGWSYEDVLPYFKKSENFSHNNPEAPYDSEYHGKGGYLHVEYHKFNSPHLYAFLSGAQELGHKLVDYNANKLGVSPSQLNMINGRREDGGKAFITPILDRKNLKVLTRSYVVKIQIVNKKAVGVFFSRNNRLYFAKATKEVILSAGAINSPQILMLSGIGPKDHLKQFHIPAVEDLGVGSTYKDHSCYYGLTFSTNYTEPTLSNRENVKQFLHGVGSLAVPGNNQGVGFFESSCSKDTGVPDIELMFIPANSSSPFSQKAFRLKDQTYDDLWGHTDPANSFAFYVVNLHAESEGTVRLRSRCPYEYPKIDTRFLSDPEDRDIQILFEGVKLALKIVETSPFKALNATRQGVPLRACKDLKGDAYEYCAIRQMTMNLYHPIGTCPMGPDPKKGAVVDSKLRVHGIRGLRVADASVFPFTLAGHPNAAVVMVGEKCADLIKNENF